MKAERWFVRAIAVTVMLGGGCTTEDPGPFAPGTFAGAHQLQIEASCKHTVDCNNTPNDYDLCVNNTAGLLEMKPESRLRFLTNFTRCSLATRCEFVTCANAMPTYGESQRAKVEFSCVQDNACETLAGRTPVNVEYCTAERIGLLDFYPAQKRAGFETAYATCMLQTSCEFVACFVF